MFFYIPLLCLTTTVVGMVWLYIHIGVGSALLVSTNRAMRRPQNVRRVTGTGSHAFCFITYIAELGGLIGKTKTELSNYD